ncbi:hypothetical protein E2C01_026336 [Portunus trituberculatus]|uniref:Uncharacterized protein n=1 Tax=Portunus trituberculatus TaxID=210409 RepID=A0A5B7EI06_PORTR|nr:hypothetical protein [Portunus trituberculatus]
MNRGTIGKLEPVPFSFHVPQLKMMHLCLSCSCINCVSTLKEKSPFVVEPATDRGFVLHVDFIGAPATTVVTHHCSEASH